MKTKLRRKDAPPSSPKPTLKFKRKGEAKEEAGATRQADEEAATPKKRKLVKPAILRAREAVLPPPYDGPLSKKFKPSHLEGCINVPLDEAPDHPQFRALDTSAIPDGVLTYYTFDTATKRVRQMTSVAVTGLRLGWGTCGRCKSHHFYCKCPRGMVHPASVEYCFRLEAWTKEHGPGTNPPASMTNTGDYLRAKHREMSYDRERHGRYANTVTASERRLMQGEEVKPDKRKLRRKATIDVADSAAVTERTHKEIARDTAALRKKLQPKEAAPAPKRKLKRKG